MTNTILIKRSSVQGKIPTTAAVSVGELALNTFDGRLYTNTYNSLTSTIVMLSGTYSYTGDLTATIINTTTLSLTLNAIATPGTYSNVVVNAKGLITSGSALTWANLGYTPVNKVGDTMTGALVISQSTGGLHLLDSPTAGQFRALGYTTGGLNRWNIGADNSAESGSNAGSNLYLSRYSDAGSVLGTVMAVTRSTGAMNIYNGLTVTNGASADSLMVTGTLIATAFQGSFVGSVAAAVAWASPMTLAHIGDVTGVGSFTGATATTISMTLAASGVTAGTYNSVIVNAKGLVTSAGVLPGNGGPFTFTGDATGTGTGTIALTLAASGVTAGTYDTIVVNSKGLVTSASNINSALTGDVTGSGLYTIAATLATVATPGTYTKVQVNAKGLVTLGSSIALSDVTTALGYTPVNKAGDTMTGALTTTTLYGVVSPATVIATGATTARTLASYFADNLNVLDFGVVGNGTTDDTAALQAALNAAVPGQVVKLSANHQYLINSANLNIPVGVVLEASWNVPGTVNNSATLGEALVLASLGGALILNTSYTVTMQSGSGIKGVPIYAKGLTIPATGSSGFAGTAITIQGDDVYLGYLLVLGFNRLSTSNTQLRGRYEWVCGDNNNGIQILNAYDTPYIHHCHMWPYACYYSLMATTAALRTGIAYDIQGTSLLSASNNFCIAYQTGYNIMSDGGAVMVDCQADWINNGATGFNIGNGTLGATSSKFVGCTTFGLSGTTLSVGYTVNLPASDYIEFLGCSSTQNYTGWNITSGDNRIIGGCVDTAYNGIYFGTNASGLICDAVRAVNITNMFVNNAGGGGSVIISPTCDFIRIDAGVPTSNLPAAIITGASPQSIPNTGEAFEIYLPVNFSVLNVGWQNRKVTLVFTGPCTLTSSYVTNGMVLAGGIPFAAQQGSVISFIYNNYYWYETSRSNPEVNIPNLYAPLTLIGTASSDTPSLGAQLLASTGWTSTGWTGSFNAWVCTSANTSTLSNTLAAVSGNQYQIGYTLSGTVGSVSIIFGGQTLTGATGTFGFGPTATSTGNLQIVPASFTGTLGLSVQQILGPSAPIMVFDTTNLTDTMEIRINTGGQSNGQYNTYIGLGAGQYNTVGYGNIGIGQAALLSNTSGIGNSAIGINALRFNTTGYSNNAQGSSALEFNTTGYANSAQGNSALFLNTTGYYNTAQGLNALYSNTAGYQNTAQGVGALQNMLMGNSNTGLGMVSLYNLSSGNNNVGVGFAAGRYYTGGSLLTTLNNSVLIGVNAQTLANGDTNEVVIGYNAVGLGSNTVNIGGASTTLTGVYGNLAVTGTIFASSIQTNTFIASSAVAWANPMTFASSGDITGICSFTGAVATTISMTLAASGVTAGTYDLVTVNAKGLVTLGSNPYTTFTGDVTGIGSYGTISMTLAASGVTAGTYNRVTVNAKGLVTSALKTYPIPPMYGTVVPKTGSANTFTLNSTLPISTLGAAIWIATYTPTSVSSFIELDGSVILDATTVTTFVGAIFRGTTCVGAMTCYHAGTIGNTPEIMNWNFMDTPSLTTAITYQMRLGNNSGVWYAATTSSGYTLGGMLANNIWSIQEYIL